MLPSEKDDFPPWGKRRFVIPLRTYSGVVVYKRKKHWFKMRDATRIMDKLAPPEDGTIEKDQYADETWQEYIMRLLKEATIKMMEKLLPFFDEKVVAKIYDWAYQLLASIFRINVDWKYFQYESINLIYLLANQVGIEVTLKIPQ